jgi:acetolactate synthase-1/3 small subunit
MNTEKEYTITVFTENFVGLLNRVTIIFTRRHINIESLTVSASEIKGIHRFTIVVKVTEEMVKKVVKQIQKQVEVLRASYFESDEIIQQEIALYKVPTKALAEGKNVELIIRNSNARILTVEKEYIVIEKTGHKEETQELFNQLEPFGILQFVRSGRIAITKEIKELHNYLVELDDKQDYSMQAHESEM